MHLDEYLSIPGSLTVRELRARMLELGYKVKSDDQIRQWRYRYSDRHPSPENCSGLELATDGKVKRQDMRPDDWHRIWLELRA